MNWIIFAVLYVLLVSVPVFYLEICVILWNQVLFFHWICFFPLLDSPWFHSRPRMAHFPYFAFTNPFLSSEWLRSSFLIEITLWLIISFHTASELTYTFFLVLYYPVLSPYVYICPYVYVCTYTQSSFFMMSILKFADKKGFSRSSLSNVLGSFRKAEF